MLRLKNISKSFKTGSRELKVLDNVNITFKSNEFVSILGKSGSGKSTLLNIMGLLDSEYNGTIYLNGKDITCYKYLINDKLLRSKIGFVFQSYNLIEDLTVYKNVEIALAVKGLKVDKTKILKTLKQCNILYLKDKKASQLSGGEKQRVAIARVLVTNPDIILLDEPTGALDSSNSYTIMKFIKKTFSNKIIIMVTHDKKLAKDFSDRIIIMSDGEIIYDSNPYQNKDKKNLFISKRKMKFRLNLKYSFSSLKRKKMRSILTMLAIIISIITISFVLFLSSGFKNKIEEYKKNIFNNYPLIIAKNNINKTDKNKINRYDDTNSIHLDKSFALDFEDFCIENNIKYLIKYDYNFNLKRDNFYDNLVKFNSFLDNKYIKENYKLLKGRLPENDKEILLKIENNSISGNVFDYFSIKTKSVSYEKIIGKIVKIKEKDASLKVVGVVTLKNKLGFDSFTSDNSSFLYNKSLDRIIDNKKEYAVYVYDNKNMVNSFLEDYSSIKSTDMAKTLEEYLTKLITSIEKILLVFSFISLIVSLLLIIVTTYTSGIEREKEIGVLKSLGARKIDIQLLFMNEIIIISFIASLISILFVMISIPILNSIFYKVTNLKNIISFSLYTTIIIIIISILTGILGSIIPAYKNSNKDVIKCLK